MPFFYKNYGELSLPIQRVGSGAGANFRPLNLTLLGRRIACQAFPNQKEWWWWCGAWSRPSSPFLYRTNCRFLGASKSREYFPIDISRGFQTGSHFSRPIRQPPINHSGAWETSIWWILPVKLARLHYHSFFSEPTTCRNHQISEYQQRQLHRARDTKWNCFGDDNLAKRRRYGSSMAALSKISRRSFAQDPNRAPLIPVRKFRQLLSSCGGHMANRLIPSLHQAKIILCPPCESRNRRREHNQWRWFRISTIRQIPIGIFTNELGPWDLRSPKALGRLWWGCRIARQCTTKRTRVEDVVSSNSQFRG